MKTVKVKNQKLQAALDKVSGKVEFTIVVLVIIAVIAAIKWRMSL